MKQRLAIRNLKSTEYSAEEDFVCDRTSDHFANYSETVQEDKIVRELVSVIMPVHDTEGDLLKKAVRSVQRQTYHNIEFIIVDDGSEWDCAKLCDEIADARTKVLHINNSGVSVARNRGIDECNGEYIIFIDSDDTMAENAIAEMVENVKGIDFVACGCRHIKNTCTQFYAVMKGYEIRDQVGCIDYLCYMTPKFACIETNAVWGKLYRKDIIGNQRFDADMIIAEDFKFNFDYIMKCSRGKYLDFNAYNYYEHEGSISRNFKPQMMKTIEKLEELIDVNKNSSIYEPLISRCVNIAFTILMMLPSYLSKDQKKIELFIDRNKCQVLKNPKTKSKVKMAILTSLLGYGFTRKIFKLFS
ncbi:Glycosyltransferase involved in cell wall bisynthesis [Butyrivibrio proteoclasticus]|uniref:Glycosyltransferase involved in cell wall bisynthesis n=1 Tax=Butyrivibrio proteoclasticus TaxID=43305 RepID=A0A1I5PWC7_9FIRM|nr:glycosyltransferase family 2 protein [Butyrivibrio proteoclasticus]SFP38199.1 Glycosyltransferase involved in cell wall bisynthesis [Butyrivibrio proteoclasticus]